MRALRVLGSKIAGEMSSGEILLSAREAICLIGRRNNRFGKVPRRPRYSTLKEPLLLLLFVSFFGSHRARYHQGRIDLHEDGK